MLMLVVILIHKIHTNDFLTNTCITILFQDSVFFILKMQKFLDFVIRRIILKNFVIISGFKLRLLPLNSDYVLCP